MPARNSLKIYSAGSFYHIYNRGVEKRTIFEDKQDYKVMLGYLKEALLPVDPNKPKTIFTLQGQSFKGEKRPVKNYSDEIDFVAYCLMPNHFHFLIRQSKSDSIEGFMRSIMTRYSMFFNKKYGRVGSLFQGRYKAVLVNEEPYLLHLSRYIHLNPAEITGSATGGYSSYDDFLGLRHTLWIKPELILSFFNNSNLIDFKKGLTYREFVEDYKGDSSLVKDLILE